MKLKARASILVVVVVVVAIAGYIFYKEGALPVDKNDSSHKIFVISPGQGLTSIANQLESEGLTRNRLVFFIVVKRLGIEKSIQAGDFRLSPSMSAPQVAQELTHGTLDVWVTIPEGLRNEEIAQKLSNVLDIPEVELLVPMEGREGYLFPDTYLIPKDADPQQIVTILENNFNKKYQEMNIEEKAREQGLSSQEVVTIASLVERESRSDADRQIIASIILKRYRIGMGLDIDATLQYMLGYQPREKTWWKASLTNDDKLLDSPYNTYQNAGLPPAPIANPGIASLIAVVEANSSTPYLYYMHEQPSGRPHYSRTLEEHEANVERYLR